MKSKKPVIIRITGGLGNQMFQYAFGAIYAMEHKRTLYLDNYSYSWAQLQNKSIHQGYELKKIFGISSALDVFTWVRSGALRYFFFVACAKINLHFFSVPRDVLVEEVSDYFSYNPDYFNQDVNYIQGFFQNSQYYDAHRNLLLEIFEFPAPATGAQAERLAQVQSVNSVSIHVRRGDYVQLPQLNICDKHYYEEAIGFITKKVEDPVFFVFSNDIEWCRNNLDLNSSTIYINDNQKHNSYRDMQLMSLCKHNIIANSSFSWWGAWLNQNPNRNIVAPSNWHRGYLAANPGNSRWHYI